MRTHTYVLPQTQHARGLSKRLYPFLGAGLLCLALICYLGMDLAKDLWLVNEAFPSLPSGFATELDAGLLFSPLTNLGGVDNAFFRLIRYPLLTSPNWPRPSDNPIGDEIQRAQKEQYLLRPNVALPLDNIMRVNESSMESFGRAVYLSQDGSDAAQAFARGRGHAELHPGFEQQSPVKQLREMFGIAYGQQALQQVTQTDK